MNGLERISSIQLGATQTAAGRRTDTPEKVRDAATEFESLLIAQMLRNIRETGSGGWMGEGEDQTASQLMGLAEEQLAHVLASQGGLGLANLTAGQIAKQSSQVTAPSTTPADPQ